MSGVRNLLNPVTALTILIAWCALAGTMYSVAATLYVGGKMSSRSFRSTTRLFLSGIFFPIIVVLALFLYWQGLYIGALLVFIIAGSCLALYWQRQKLAIAWRYLAIVSRYGWPTVALVATIAIPLAAALRGLSILVMVLAMVLSVLLATCVAHLVAPRLLEGTWVFRAVLLRLPSRTRPRAARHLWEYDFIEHFQDGVARVYSTEAPNGMVAKVVTHLESGADMGKALWEHPPWRGDAVIQYLVTGIDPRVIALRLQGRYGILEEFRDDDGTVKTCGFPGDGHEGNKVGFEVWVKQQKVLHDEKDAQGWTPIEHKKSFVPYHSFLIVEFRTNAMDDPHYNWAAWKDLKLVEVV